MSDRSPHERDAEFTGFVEMASPELLRIAWFLTGDVHRAQDLVQNALIRIYRTWDRVDLDRAVPYTRTVMVNLARSTWRRERRSITVERIEDFASPVGDHADAAAETDRLVRHVFALPVRQRTVVVLRYYCDLSERECAEVLGISAGTVKSAASRGLAALRETVRTEEVRHDNRL